MPKKVAILLIFILHCLSVAKAQIFGNEKAIADTFLVHKQYSEALAKYTYVLNIPNLDSLQKSALYSNRSQCNFFLHKNKEGIEDATTAINLSPKEGRLYWNRSLIYKDNKNYDLAISDFTIALNFIKSKPFLSKIYDGRAQLKLYLEHYEDALKDDSISLTLNIKNEFAYWHRGMAYHLLKKFQLSIDEYNNAIKFETDKDNLATLYNNIRDNHRSLKQFDKAIEDETLAISLKPGEGAYYWNRGDDYQSNKNYQFSIEDYNKAIVFYKDKKESLGALYNDLCYSEMILGNYKTALFDNTKAIELNPSYKFAYWLKGEILAQMGEHVNAAAAYSKAMVMYTDKVHQYVVLYNLKVTEEYYYSKPDSLLLSANKNVSLNPKDQYVFYLLGKIYLKKLHDKINADKNFKKALELDTAKADIFNNYYLGDTDLALKNANKKILESRTDKDLSIAYYNIACLYSLMGKKMEALNYLQFAVDKGYNKNYALNDDDFDNIRNTEEFKKFIAN